MSSLAPFKETRAVGALLLSACSGEPRREISIDVTVEVEAASSSTSGQKDVLIRLTREDNVQFLYTTRICEVDYGTLRSEQNLGPHWHEFAHFPTMFSGLVQKCASNKGKSDQPKRWMQLTEQRTNSGAVTLRMEILQATDVKPVILLALVFVAATDAQVKDHLTSKVKRLKMKLFEVAKETKSQQSKATETITRLTKQLDSNKELICRLEKEHLAELANLRSDFEKEHLQWRKETDEKCAEYRDVQYENEKLEEEVDELKAQLGKEQDKNRNLQEDFDHEKNMNDKLNAALDRFENRLAEVTADFEEKSVLCDQLQKEIDRLVDRQADLKSKLKFEESEKKKGIEIIKKMMDRTRTVKEKITGNDDEVSECEAKLKSVKSELEAAKVELKNERADTQKLQSENKLLKDQCAASSAEKEQLIADVKSKEKLIADMHRTFMQPAAAIMPHPNLYPSAAPIYNVSPSYRPVLGLQNATNARTAHVGMLHNPNEQFASVSPISLRVNTRTAPLPRSTDLPNV